MAKSLMPVVVVGLLIVTLGVLYGPRMIRGYHFRQTVSEMLLNIKAGQNTQAMSCVSKPQRQIAETVTSAALGSDFYNSIASLKLTDTRWINDDTISATVTCRLDYEGASPIYQGRLLWHFENGAWAWDFFGSYVGEYAGLEEPTWVKLGEILEVMENY